MIDLLVHGPASRADLARRAGLSPAVSGEGVALASAVLNTAGKCARSVQHWTLPDVPIEIAPFNFTEWAKGAAIIALRNQLDSALRPDT